MTTTQDWSDLSLIGLFRLEVETQMAVMTEHLMVLEQRNMPGSDSLDSLMRAAHSIKGAARIVQVEPVVKVAHSLEDFFMAAGQNIVQLTSDHVDVLLLAADFISRLSQLEESELVSQGATYEADANTIVLSIEGLVTTALKAAEPAIAASAIADDAFAIEQSTGLVADAAIAGSAVTSSDVFEAGVSEAGVFDADVADSDRPGHELSQPVTAPRSATHSEDPSARMIRMSAANLNRLMGLAGESLVESNWLQPFATSLLQLKRRQQSVLALLQQMSQQATEQPSTWSLASPMAPQAADLDRAVEEIQVCHSLLSDQLSDLDLFSRRFGQLSDRLYREVIASHMCSFESGCRGYSRLVRDLSRDVNKRVSLKIDGLMTQVDRDILEKLDAPITHLLTNAIAHGIELPEARRSAGKPAEGQVRIEAVHRSGMLVITVEDDGAGIDYARLREKIVQKGMTPADVVAKLSEAELIEFLFLPGFSTAKQVDKVAGRGYGLDIARNMVQSVGGSLQASSSRQVGTRFQFQLPLTLSVVRSLLVDIAGEPYAMSLARIGRVLRLRTDQLCYSESRPYFSLNSDVLEGDQAGYAAKGAVGTAENISLVSARQVLGLPEIAVPAQMWVVVVGEPGHRYGLWVDALLEERDLVVRPLDARLGKVPNVSSAALTEKGEPILILDTADVIRSAARVAEGEAFSRITLSEVADPSMPQTMPQTMRQSDASAPGLSRPPTQKRVLVVDDSMTVRAMEKKLLQNRGYEVDVAVDGAEGWNAMRANTYDLVITDVDMPRMNGIELIERMRGHEPTRTLPVIVVSYKDRAEDQMAGLDAGANYYLTKSSFHDDGLINAVIDLVGAA